MLSDSFPIVLSLPSHKTVTSFDLENTSSGKQIKGQILWLLQEVVMHGLTKQFLTILKRVCCVVWCYHVM